MKSTTALFGFLRTSQSPSAALDSMREQTRQLASRRATLATERQSLAHAELLGDETATSRRRQLATEIAEVDQQAATLVDALPTAEARAVAAYQKERQGLIESLRVDLRLCQQERDELLTELIAKPLPSLELMQQLRVLARECGAIGNVITSVTDERFAEVDALQHLRSAMHDRHEEFTRRLMRTGSGRPDFSTRAWTSTAERLRMTKSPVQ